MKFLTLVILFFCTFLPSVAATGWKSLVVQLRGSSPIVLDLSETLAVEVTERAVLISDAGVDYELPLADVISLSHGREAVNNISTSAELVSADSPASISLSGRELRFSGFAPGTVAQVFSVAGTKVSFFIVDDEAGLPLSSLAAGNYIVTAGDVSLKISYRP